MPTLISIVVPTFNRTEYLERTLNSILNQTFQDFEIIVVDDNPDSRLKEQTKLLENKKIQYFKNDANKGACFSRNFGAWKAKGEYIAFLDDDDEWLPCKLEKQIARFNLLDESFGVVYCGYDYLFNKKIIKKNNIYYPENHLYKIALKKCPIGSPTALIRKQVFLKTSGYDLTLPSCQDWDLWIRLSKICKFSPVQETLALYRIHGDQISNSMIKKINGREKLLEKYFSVLSHFPEILSWHYRRLGSLCSLAEDKKSALKFFKLSWQADKSNTGTWLHILLLMSNSKLHQWITKKYGVTNINGVKIIN